MTKTTPNNAAPAKPPRKRKAAVSPYTAAPAAKPASKLATIIDLMRRDGGATIAEMVAATGWLPHTTRAALTGLRKKGHGIARGTRDGATCYTLPAA